MRKITKYAADDGREFKDALSCAKYELLCAKAFIIMSALPPIPVDDDCSFTNGHGYIQLSESLVLETKSKLLDLIGTEVDHKWVDDSRAVGVHPSYVGRLLDDYDIPPLSHAWHRISCIDNLWREWGQPYFANNPDKGEQFAL